MALWLTFVDQKLFGLVLSTNSSKAGTSRDHSFSCFLSPDFYELCRSVMSACLLTEVKRQRAKVVLGWVTTSVCFSFL